MRTSFHPTVHAAYMIAFVLLIAPELATAQQSPAKRPSVDVQQTLAVQVALDRAGFSPGEIDGQAGAKTRLALTEFQRSANLQVNGIANEETVTALRLPPEPLVN